MGADEVIYLNERGELTEGSRTNIFIERDGALLTPPLSRGCCPARCAPSSSPKGARVEAVLTLDDLEAADRVYLGNSVRGLVRRHAAVDA